MDLEIFGIKPLVFFYIDNKQLPKMSIVVLQLGSTEASRIRSNNPSSGESSFLYFRFYFHFVKS